MNLKSRHFWHWVSTWACLIIGAGAFYRAGQVGGWWRYGIGVVDLLGAANSFFVLGRIRQIRAARRFREELFRPREEMLH